MKECEQICQALKEGVRCVLLRGAAGTGKTTLVRDLLPHIQMMGCHPILLAPTGRAAKVLELRTGRKARTIHAAIYDVPSEPMHAPIVTYGYALTVHKAQGGDWDEVWVDCRYAGCPNSEEYFRWMYTATTRAKRKLVVVEAPRIDDLVEALSNGIERMEREGVAEDNVPEHPVRNLGDVLGTGGYLLRRCVERDWVHRCFVGHAGSDLECGWIDVGYNGKKTVTHLSIHIEDLAESVRKDLLSLKGLPMNRVMGSERRPETPEKGLPEICVVPQHELVANRLCVAAHGRLTILSVTSKGPFLLRMTLRTERGVAFVDCYFDGKGVVTKMGNATLPLEDLRALRDGLTAKKKERNVQDDA